MTHFAGRRQFASVCLSAVLILGSTSLSFAQEKGTSDEETSSPGNRISESPSGFIYVLDGDNHRVQIFDQKGIYQSQFDHSFDLPSGLALYARSRVYVKDGNHNCEADEFDSNGDYLLQFGVCANNGVGLGIFDNIGSIAVAGTDVWVTSPDFYYIQKVDSSGNFLGIVCMDVDVKGCPPATKFLVQPYGIALDANGDIYVTNVYPFSGGFNIVKFNGKGEYLSSFGSIGSGNGQFNNPVGIAIDSKGIIYVADTGNNRVQKFDQNGIYQSQFGTFGSGDGQFNYPTGIAFDDAGDIYVTDVDNNRVEKFNSQGVYQSQFGSYGQGNGQFFGPFAIAITK